MTEQQIWRERTIALCERILRASNKTDDSVFTRIKNVHDICRHYIEREYDD